MKPYTTTIENILPGMIVRLTHPEPDCDHSRTYTFTVRYTRLPGEHGEGLLVGEGCGFAVDADTEITVLHDPTQDGQDVWMNAEIMSDEAIARRAADQVAAYHRDRGPQQYKTGGLDLPLNPYAL